MTRQQGEPKPIRNQESYQSFKSEGSYHIASRVDIRDKYFIASFDILEYLNQFKRNPVKGVGTHDWARQSKII